MAREKWRLNLDLDQEGKERIMALKKRMGASSLSEVFRKALSALELFVEVQSAGGEIIIKEDGKEKHLVVLT